MEKAWVAAVNTKIVPREVLEICGPDPGERRAGGDSLADEQEWGRRQLLYVADLAALMTRAQVC